MLNPVLFPNSFLNSYPIISATSAVKSEKDTLADSLSSVVGDRKTSNINRYDGNSSPPHRGQKLDLYV